MKTASVACWEAVQSSHEAGQDYSWAGLMAAQAVPPGFER